MRNLHIIDVSATLHAGVCVFSENNSHGFPTGGIFNTLKCFSGKGFDPTKDQVLFCFDRKTRQTDENGESTGYKEGRKRWTSSMYFQAKLLEEMLQKCGFYVFFQENRESDEGIIQYARKFINSFEHTYIYGTDRDLTCVVSPKSTLVSTHSNVVSVTMENYSYAVAPGEFIPYNTTLLYKIFRKDTSDTIKGILNPSQFQDLIRELQEARFPMHALNTDEALKFVIERYKCTEEQKALLWDNYRAVVPRDVELIHDLTVPAPLNAEMIDRYCSALSLSLFAKKFNKTITGEVDEAWYNEIVELGNIVKEELINLNEGNPNYRLPADFIPKYFQLVNKPCDSGFFDSYFD